MYNYNHLYYFYVTAKSGSVMTAATLLSISQPSLTSQLKVLERSLERETLSKNRTHQSPNSSRSGDLWFLQTNV